MRQPEWTPLLQRTCALALEFLHSLPERPVGPAHDAAELFARFDVPLPDSSSDPRAVVEELVGLAEPGLTAMPGGRFFGWVIGGGLPAAVAADWLTTVWDQNAGSALGTPAAVAIEQVALGWVARLLELPATSAALVTGAQAANFVCLAAARSEVLRQVGWDVEADGLVGAPPVRVVVGAERHATIDRALRLLGFGVRRLVVVGADDEGQMRADALAAELASGDEPTIVCGQAGNVNGGGFDPMSSIVETVARARRRAPVWLHVDGAFGLWARVSPTRRALAAGIEEADSWTVDAHKWLNAPYDSGIALTRHAEAHRRALRSGATYLPDDNPVVRNPFDYTPELSRRARGFALWAALRQLGRAGVRALIDRSCDLAAQLAAELAAVPGVEVMNQVRLNQLVVRFRDPAGGDDDAHTRAVLDRVVRGGVCYPSATVWRDVAAIRISVSNWSTDRDDIPRVVGAIAAAHRGEQAAERTVPANHHPRDRSGGATYRLSQGGADMKRKASARWNGGLKNGNGTISTGSRALSDLKYSFTTRFEDAPGTNPEELIAAAHAGCFSMALSAQLGGAGLEPKSIETDATLTMEKLDAGWTVTAVHLDVKAVVPGASAAAFREHAEGAKKGCIISRLLKAEITMNATLVE